VSAIRWKDIPFLIGCSDEVATLFQPAVEGIIKAIKKQRSQAKRKVEVSI
jgi:hypothetical protein